MKLLKPTYIFENVYSIPVSFFKEHNFKAIILDVDNTLVLADKTMPSQVSTWLEAVKKEGIALCLLSNAYTENTINYIKKKFDIYGLAYAKKPLKKGFYMALNILDVKKEECCIIGDQLFTDVLGANLVHMRSIYTARLSKGEAFITKIKRPLEYLILDKEKKKGK